MDEWIGFNPFTTEAHTWSDVFVHNSYILEYNEKYLTKSCLSSWVEQSSIIMFAILLKCVNYKQ